MFLCQNSMRIPVTVRRNTIDGIQHILMKKTDDILIFNATCSGKDI